MVCDYLFCGTCFLNFRLSDITLFIEHKKNDCVATNTNSGCGRPSPDNLMANLLECVQCFRKFPTAWPLLMHVQVEHQLLFANAFRQASFTPRKDSIPIASAMQSDEKMTDMEPGSSNSELVLDEDSPTPLNSTKIVSTTTPQLPTQSTQHLSTIGTQTNVSWFRSQSRLMRKRALCCASSIDTDAPCTDETCPSEERLCQCSTARLSNPMYSCRCCCSQSSLKTVACPPCGASSVLQTNHFSGPASGTYTATSSMDSISPSDHGTTACCLPANPPNCCSNGLVLSASQSMAISCCPCPPSKRASMHSSETQTDFDPEFSTPDYADIAMLLATPDRESIYQSEVEQLTTVIDPADWSQDPIDTPLDTGEMPHSRIVPPTASISEEVNYPNPIQPDESSVTQTLPPPPLLPSETASPCLMPAKRVDWVNSMHHIPTEEVVTLEPPYTLTTSTALHISPHDTTVTRSVTHQFVCSECGNQYRQKVHLRKHIMTQHTRQKPYRCPSCSYTTVEKSHLTVHVRTHTGERPFVCRECDYASAQNCTLKAHYIRKHLNSRIFCSKCDEPFYTELERANHERLCLGSRSYAPPTIPVPLVSTNAPRTHNIKASASPTRDLNAIL